jgi:hypothetical protein
MRHAAISIIGCLALVASAADKQVTPQEARNWIAGIRAAELRGDVKTVISMTREETVFYVKLSEYVGAGFKLSGQSLREWIEKSVTRNKGKVKSGLRCGYEPVLEEGTVVERCVAPATEVMNGSAKSSEDFIYTVNVISKDGRGLFAKTAWVSDKKLF